MKINKNKIKQDDDIETENFELIQENTEKELSIEDEYIAKDEFVLMVKDYYIKYKDLMFDNEIEHFVHFIEHIEKKFNVNLVGNLPNVYLRMRK